MFMLCGLCVGCGLLKLQTVPENCFVKTSRVPGKYKNRRVLLIFLGTLLYHSLDRVISKHFLSDFS